MEKTGNPLAKGRTTGTEKNKSGLSSLPSNVHKFEIPIKGTDIREGLRIFAYLDFGFFTYRSKRLYLAAHCGPIGQNGNGGHGHNDQLEIELNVDGQDWIADPGTYVYTPLPDQRNKFRSVKAHFTPQIGIEPNSINSNLFQMGNDSNALCNFFLPTKFTGTLLHRPDKQTQLSLRILPCSIEITYFSTEKIHDNSTEKADLGHSPGYGKMTCNIN